MFWHVSVRRSTHLSVHTWGMGGNPSQVQVGGTPTGGYPNWGGYPSRGYPTLGTPHQTWWGVPWRGGYPTSGTPCQTWWGTPIWTWWPGVPQVGGTPPQVPPVRPGWGVPWLGGVPIWSSTWYAAVGMPLAFTQEDFLVNVCFWSYLNYLKLIEHDGFPIHRWGSIPLFPRNLFWGLKCLKHDFPWHNVEASVSQTSSSLQYHGFEKWYKFKLKDSVHHKIKTNQTRRQDWKVVLKNSDHFKPELNDYHPQKVNHYFGRGLHWRKSTNFSIKW